MAVPEFYYFIRPALEFHVDGQPHHWRDVEADAIHRFNLSPQDLEDLIPSGRKTRVADRVQWALTYLRQAKLLESPKRGVNQITERGRDYMKRAPEVINPEALGEFSEFGTFYRPTHAKSPGDGAIDKGQSLVSVKTPQEAIETAFAEYRESLARDVLEQVKALPPSRFEQLIVDLMLRLGYGGPEKSGRRLGRTGDEGVDGVIDQDKLGLEKIYLQAKRWGDGKVGRKEVQAFVGALSGQSAAKGVFITTSVFTDDARDYASKTAHVKISLVDGPTLARLMIDNDLGVALEKRYDVKRVDSDFFGEE
ncbi:MAG: restriction endonuclease [Anaerolineae bacterium]